MSMHRSSSSRKIAWRAQAAREDDLLAWARESLVPLPAVTSQDDWSDVAPLVDMIGDASVVALSEGVHCGAEPLRFRNRLVEYLVRKKGFTAIALESGVVESRAVHDYVLDAKGSLSHAVEQGLSWTFEQLPQNRTLVEWLRQYNADARNVRKVNFYGFDISGSPGNSQARRGIDTGLREALEYLGQVDRDAAAAFQRRIGAQLDRLRFGLHRLPQPGYESLSAEQRDALTAAIADLIVLFERREARYIAASSALDYKWACRAALAARQVDAWLREIPLGWQPLRATDPFPSERISFMSAAGEVRDRAQADNLEWIVRQEGEAGKVLIFAHRYHLSTAPVKANFWLPNGEEREHEVAGTYLKRRFGDRLVTIGNMLGSGEVSCGDFRQRLERPPPSSADGLMSLLDVPVFVLDLRAAPTHVNQWLMQEHSLAHGRQVFKLPIRGAFDIVYYLDTITPAVSVGEIGARR